MASGLPKNIVPPLDLSQTSSSTTIGSQTLAGVTDNVKRHVAVGIAFNNVLVPELRTVIARRLEKHYNSLVTKNQINTENNDLWKPEQYGFSYRDPKDDFVVSSHHELAKLFMEAHMVKFKHITDSTFDGSAALNVIEKAYCFSKGEKGAAKEIRLNLRNPWAHCNSDEWEDNKFLESFKLMEELVTAISKPHNTKTMPKSFDATKIHSHMRAWKEDGLKLMGKNVDPALLNRVFEEHQKVMKTLVEENVEIEKFKEQQKVIREAVRKILERQGAFEAEQISMKESILDNAERITYLETTSQKRATPLFRPPTKNECFTGRKDNLKTISTALQGDSCPIVTIQGLGGVGKTTLALEAAWKEKENFPGGVYWLTADSDTGDATIKASLYGLARRMEKIPSDTDADRMVDIVTSHLIQQKRSLLVIDNLDSDELSPLVNRLVNGMWWVQDEEAEVAMLITSRLEGDRLRRNVNRASTNIHLDSFSLDEGVEFLRRRTDRTDLVELDAKDLVNALGGLPLALDQAAAYIKHSTRSLDQYIKKLGKAKLKFLNEEKAHKATEYVDKNRLAVQTTWRMNMDAIKEDVLEAEKLTHILAFLSPRCIPKSIINEGTPRLEDENLADALSDEFDVDHMLLKLRKMSLFEEASENSIRVHRMVQEIIKDDVIKKNILEHTLQNVQKMLSRAVDVEESPSKYLECNEKDIKWTVETLGGWSMVMENVGHFMEELKSLQLNLKTEFNGTAKLLDHSSLYYYVLNQTERAAVYRELMDEHLSKAKGEHMYKPQFPLPRSPNEKEVIGRLMEPPTKDLEEEDEELKELRAQESKQRGDQCVGEKKYWQALESYNTALENTASGALKLKVSLNRCRVLYKLGKADKCIEQAESVLQDTPQNPAAFLWIALGYTKKEDEVKSKLPDQEASKPEKLECAIFGELSYAYAALSLHWAQDEKDKIEGILKQHKIAMFRTRVIEVDSRDSLKRAVTISNANRQARIRGEHGERHIILVKAGTYRMGPSFWQTLESTLIVGDNSGPKPVFFIDNNNPVFVGKNMLVNLHFKIKTGQITFCLREDPLLFLHCSFESKYHHNSRSDCKLTSEQKEKLMLQKIELLRSARAGANYSAEEVEQRKLTESKISLNKSVEDMLLKGNAPSALLVLQGRCALIKCEIKDCDGAGVLVTEAGERAPPSLSKSLSKQLDMLKIDDPEKRAKIEAAKEHMVAFVDDEPYLYMKGSTVTSCGFSGIESRDRGSMFLEDCSISNNTKGVLAWQNAKNVTIRGSTIHANKCEGVHVADGYESYDNSTRLVLEDTHVHHNQIGISLEWVRSVSIQKCQVFLNKSWGIYMRNSNVATIRGNDVFRNDCGGIRVCFNRFGHSVVMKNLIHDHTGPDFVQTVFKSEGEQEQLRFFNKEANRAPVLVMDNLSYNNDLSYGSIADWRVSMERPCGFCNKKGAGNMCQRCTRVVYCNDRCQTSDRRDHKAFCDYFIETNVVELSLIPMKFERRNKLIEDRTAKKQLKDYRGKDFLVKISAGDDGFGLDRSGDAKSSVAGATRTGEAGDLWIYDEFRFISGATKCPKIFDLVRQFGKLSGEKCYNKRIFLFARLLGGPHPVWKISVRTDQLFHEQGW